MSDSLSHAGGYAVVKKATARRLPWNVILGSVLMGIAAIFLFDPDYPLPRGASDTSANWTPELAPRAASPVGRTGVPTEFAWTPHEGLFRVVVLDASFREIYRAPKASRESLPMPDALGGRLRKGQRYHWFIVAEDDPERFSGPVAFDVW